jgi:hypothetical protein
VVRSTSRASPIWTCTRGLSSTSWFTEAQKRATSRIEASSSATSTLSMPGTAPSQPAVLPVPRPTTIAVFAPGWSACEQPLITWVGPSSVA